MIATATCPRCNSTNQLFACENCGGTDYRTGPLSDGSVGLICKACNIGFSHIPCQSGCGALIPATAFGTPSSRLARRALAGMEAYEDGKCFIATELYGIGSVEVATLRQFRDQILLKNFVGRTFVTTYYRVAPTIASAMHKSIVLRLLLQALVALSVFIVRRKESIGSGSIDLEI